MNQLVVSAHFTAWENGICADCGANMLRHFTYLWANQYGWCIRHFCDECGSYYDVETLHGLGFSRVIRAGNVRKTFQPSDIPF